MRLIDADALKRNMFAYAPPEMILDRDDIEHKIDEMPTIDAVPVDKLLKRIHERFCGNCMIDRGSAACEGCAVGEIIALIEEGKHEKG